MVKKKKKTKAQIEAAAKAVEDSTAAAEAAAAAQAAAAGAAAATVPSDEIVPDPHSDGLIADSSEFAYLEFPMDSTRPVDGYYKVPMLRGAKPFEMPNPPVRNTKFYKRIYRTIDLNDSANKIFCVQGSSLMQIFMDALKAEKIVAYKNDDFRARYTYPQVLRLLSDSVVIDVQDSLTGEVIASRSEFNPFNPETVKMFELKEDIFFDKIRGRVITKIIGISPVTRKKGSTGIDMGEQHPFWLYFDQCRTVLANKDVFDTQRDIYNMSYDDVFLQRSFHSVIVKESNPAENRLKDIYPDDPEAQKAAAARIEAQIKHYKKNVWKY